MISKTIFKPDVGEFGDSTVQLQHHQLGVKEKSE